MSHPDLAGFPVVIALDVAWGEMDSCGHVNNVVYFRYFENARVEYLRRVGWFDSLKAGGPGPILHSTEARFRRPLAYPDRVLSAARAVAVDADRVTLEHRLVSTQLGGVAADGRSVVVCYDYAAARKAPLPDALRDRIADLERAGS